MPETRSLTIGALARAAGVGVETVRFYERKGLLPEPPRTAAGYRQYPPTAVDRLEFIRRAKDLGFALREISELLDLRVRANEIAACDRVEAQARDKLEQVTAKISELQRIRGALQHLVEACRASEATSECPILEELDHSTPPER